MNALDFLDGLDSLFKLLGTKGGTLYKLRGYLGLFQYIGTIKVYIGVLYGDKIKGPF